MIDAPTRTSRSQPRAASRRPDRGRPHESFTERSGRRPVAYQPSTQLRRRSTTYDYAGQDPIDGYDLAGTCSSKNAHSFVHSWSFGCAWQGIKDDLMGRNGRFMQAVAATDLALVTEGAGSAVAGSARISALAGRIDALTQGAKLAAAARVSAGAIFVGVKGGAMQMATNFMSAFQQADAAFRGMSPAWAKYLAQTLAGLRAVFRGRP